MATMVVLLLVPSVAMLAFLFLVLTIRHAKSKRFGKTRATIHSREAQIGMRRGESSSCETCHMCGGLRLRSPNAGMLEDAASSQSYDPPRIAVSNHVPVVRSKPPLKHWAAMKARISTSVKNLLLKVLSHQRKQSPEEFLRRLKKLLMFSWCKAPTGSKATLTVPTCVPNEECSTFSRAKVCTEGAIASEVFCNAEKSDFALVSPCASSDMPSSEANLNSAGLDVVKAQGLAGVADSDTSVAAIHRLVLEILVSPSVNQDCRSQNGCSASASALTLKLETSPAQGHLSVCADTLKSKASNCLPRDSIFKASGIQDLTSQVSNEAVWVPDARIPCPSENLKPSGNTKVTAREGCAGSPMLDSKCCGEICRSLHECMDGDSIKSVGSHVAPAWQSTGTEQFTFSFGNHACKNITSDTAHKFSAELKESSAGSETASVSSLSGSRSVHTTLLKSDAQEECADKANGQVGSPLASLNVAGRPFGRSVLSNPNKEKLNIKAGVFTETICSLSPKSSASNVREQQQMERGDHSSVQAVTDTSSNDYFGSSSKKERRKKKSKGKKPASKIGALMADSQDRQELGKIALEAAKHVSPVPEREIGCVCGALKGNLHNETCPYPFTSSGSMLQRKIKEQYDDLVRSNASKRLTLAQVGQFTSCLVEAKAALQQKSDSIQRKFTITKSLLSKANKSSFDRLCGQIYGLEMEQKKVEEDTVVYNRLQEQLKLSPAYKKMLEYGRAHCEVQPHTRQMIEKLEPEEPEISFEELLAQEKKDGFWQRHSLARSAR